jgi:hypothetical protein
MEPLSIAFIVVLVVLLAWVGAKYYFASEDLKTYQAENRRLNDVIRSLKNSDNEDEDENLPEIAVGSEVEIELDGWLVLGRIESIAATNKQKELGFEFRAHDDKSVLWLSYDYPIEVVDDEEDDEKPATAEASPDSNALFPPSGSGSLFPVSNG